LVGSDINNKIFHQYSFYPQETQRHLNEGTVHNVQIAALNGKSNGHNFRYLMIESAFVFNSKMQTNMPAAIDRDLDIRSYYKNKVIITLPLIIVSPWS
jgi:hypothetical protein